MITDGDDYIDLVPTAREAAYHLAGTSLGYYLLGLDPAGAADAGGPGPDEPLDLAFVSFMGAASIAASYLVDVAVVNQDPRGLDVEMLGDHLVYARDGAALGPTPGLNQTSHLEDDDHAIAYETLLWLLRTHWVGISGLADRLQTSAAGDISDEEIRAAVTRTEPSHWLCGLDETLGDC